MTRARGDIRIFGTGDCKYEYVRKESFMISDTLCILNDMKRPDTILLKITIYTGTKEQKKELIEEILSGFKDKDNVAILICACASTYDYPESEYYDSSLSEDSEEVKEAIKAGKKPLPYDEAIAKESELLESIGFVDFNFYVNYEFSKAYLYGNKLGLEIIEYTKSLQDNK